MLGGGGGLDTMEETSLSFHSLPAVEWLALVITPPAHAQQGPAGVCAWRRQHEHRNLID